MNSLAPEDMARTADVMKTAATLNSMSQTIIRAQQREIELLRQQLTETQFRLTHAIEQPTTYLKRQPCAIP